jgi:PEP-CTERM motif
MRNNMTNRNTLLWMFACVAVLFFAAGQRDAFASSISETVTIDTSGLPATPGSEIFFVLTDGSGTGDANNTAALSAFTFGGGSAGAVDTLSSTGDVSGDMAAGVSMTDSSFTNVLAQYFTAGTALSFALNLTTNVDPGSTPDQFGFVILDPSLNPISTSDPTGSNYLALINIDSSSPSPVSYSGLVTISPQGTVATPEPATLFLLAAGLAAIALFAKRLTTLD